MTKFYVPMTPNHRVDHPKALRSSEDKNTTIIVCIDRVHDHIQELKDAVGSTIFFVDRYLEDLLSKSSSIQELTLDLPI